MTQKSKANSYQTHIMYYNIFATALIIFLLLIFTASCSMHKTVIYHPNINQGNYFTKTDVDQIYIGMTKKQVFCTLGRPIITDLFSSNTLHYIYRYEPSYNYFVQNILTLTFNNRDILIHINKQCTNMVPIFMRSTKI